MKTESLGPLACPACHAALILQADLESREAGRMCEVKSIS
jgi:hypothetical protein